MKLSNFLVIFSCLFFSVSAKAETDKKFGNSYIAFKFEKHYRFEMDVIKNTEDQLDMHSKKIFKKINYSFEPLEETPEDSPYHDFKYSRESEELLDDSISLNLYLSDFVKFNDSQWFNKSLLQFREKFIPYSNPVKIAKTLLDRQNITDTAHRDNILKQTVWLTSKYALSEPHYDKDVESKVFDRKTITRNYVQEWEKSQQLSIEAENFAFYARGNKTRITAKNLDSFYFSKTYFSLTKKLHKSLHKNNNVNYAYIMLLFTNIMPLEVYTAEPYTRSNFIYEDSEKYPAYESLENPITGDSDLTCLRKSKKKFTCYYSELNYAVLKMPNSDEIKEFRYPNFLINYLKEKKVTNEDLEKGASKIDLNSLRHFDY